MIQDKKMLLNDILNGLKNGQNESYKYLYDEFYCKLCRVANFYVHDTFVSENLVGDLIFYLWEKKEELVIHESLNAYLFISIRNRCFNYLNQAHVQKEISITGLQENILINSMHSQTDLPIGILIEKDLQNKIDSSINQLPPHTKKVFELKRKEELSYEEIALKLNISVNTVRYHMKAALKTLRIKLAAYLYTIFLLIVFLH